MKPVDAKQVEYAQAALRAVYGPPLSPEELAEFNVLRAREMARAEARRSPSPQLDLPEGE